MCNYVNIPIKKKDDFGGGNDLALTTKICHCVVTCISFPFVLSNIIQLFNSKWFP